ncbi:hypothetical protein [Crateriforma conspicua]|nr:hypothetical protein [Crateriforma conspicua]
MSTGSQPTYCDALQVLVDELDDRLSADIFGTVTCKGKHAFVVLEADYFVRLDPKAKRELLTRLRDEWVNRCFGNKVTFKTWDGKIVAEL